MAISAVRRGGEGTEAMAIGDPDGAIFVCRSCSRPVASGARRCPGCGARFLLDVPLQRAVSFVAMGLAAGLLIGGGGVGLAAMVTAPGTAAEPSATVPGDALPSVAPAPTTGSDAGSGTPTVPPAAVAALRGTTTINGRLAELAPVLTAELAAETLDASTVARALRRVALEVGAAETLVPALATWTSAERYAAELDAFYGSLGERVREGLGASVRNEAAYRAAATDVAAMLGTLTALEGSARMLASAADTTGPAAP